jgi:lysophospholipase L1-like esterase
MKKRKSAFLYFSLIINLLLVGVLFVLIQRLGGWRYALQRLRHNETGLYAHRKQLFERLPERRGAVVFLGDSQTEQCEWAELLRSDSIPVLNRGITADHTAGVLARLPDVYRHAPSKVFLMIGINDLLFGTPPDEIENNYRSIVAEIRRNVPDAMLALQSVLPVNNAVKQTGLENAAVRDLNARIARIAKTYALPFVDICTALSDADGNLSSKCTEDGLHLNASGYLVWKKQIEVYF